MGQVQFAGSWYATIKQAARAWSLSALPDASVIGADEDVTEAARGLEAYWHTEAQKTEDPAADAVTEAAWREACRHALVDRIEAHRSGSAPM